MKLLRWTLAGASFYVIYKYAIGKKAKGEEVFQSPDSGQDEAPQPPPAKASRPKKPRTRKKPSSD